MRNVSDTERDQVVGSLATLLEGASAGQISFADVRDHAEVSLRSLGLDSIVYLSFIRSVEERFSVRWREDAPSEVFETLGTLASHLVECADPEVNAQPTSGVGGRGPSPLGGGVLGVVEECSS